MRQRPELSQQTRPINIAVIGAGYWGQKVIREIMSLANETRLVRLKTVVDPSPTILRQCSQEFGPLDYRLDYSDLVSDDSIDAVYVSSPNATHFEVASAFVKHRKNVLVDKPLTLNPNQADQLVSLAKKLSVILCVGHIYRFNNVVRELRNRISSGDIGRPYYLRVQWTGYLSPRPSLDVLDDLSPHPLDICNMLLGTWPVGVSCTTNRFRIPDGNESAFINFDYHNGTSAHIEVSWLDHEIRREVFVVGSEGLAYLDCTQGKAVIRRHSEVRRIPVPQNNTLRDMIGHFVDCINARSRSEPFPNLIDGTLGARVVTLVDAARESAIQGRRLTLRLPKVARQELASSSESPLELVEAQGSNEPSENYSIDRPSASGGFFSISSAMEAALEGKLRGSRYRMEILLRLGVADAGPKDLATSVGLDISNLGKYLRDLAQDGLVMLKTPSDMRKGKIYGLTRKGYELFGRISGVPAVRNASDDFGAVES